MCSCLLNVAYLRLSGGVLKVKAGQSVSVLLRFAPNHHMSRATPWNYTKNKHTDVSVLTENNSLAWTRLYYSTLEFYCSIVRTRVSMLTGQKRRLCLCVRQEQRENHWRGAGGPERGDNTRVMGRLLQRARRQCWGGHTPVCCRVTVFGWVSHQKAALCHRQGVTWLTWWRNTAQHTHSHTRTHTHNHKNKAHAQSKITEKQRHNIFKMQWAFSRFYYFHKYGSIL